MGSRYGGRYAGNGGYLGPTINYNAAQKKEAPCEIVAVKDERSVCEKPCEERCELPQKQSSIIDKITGLIAPVFRKIFKREPEIGDIVIIGLIILLFLDRKNDAKGGGKGEKGEFSLKNLADNDILLIALLYIFL